MISKDFPKAHIRSFEVEPNFLLTCNATVDQIFKEDWRVVSIPTLYTGNPWFKS